MKDRTDVIAEARFRCAACDKEAGHVRLFGGPASAEVRRTSFTSSLTSTVSGESFSELRSAIERRDPRALYRLDLEYAPFFCPQCEAVYCGGHWEKRDVFDDDDPSWHDSVRGRCPKGHERMLED
jgi:hypothetical protein